MQGDADLLDSTTSLALTSSTNELSGWIQTSAGEREGTESQ